MALSSRGGRGGMMRGGLQGRGGRGGPPRGGGMVRGGDRGGFGGPGGRLVGYNSDFNLTFDFICLHKINCCFPEDEAWV